MKKVNITKAGMLSLFAMISVLSAYVYGVVGEERDFQQKLFAAFPKMTIDATTGANPICYHAIFPEGRKYVVLKKTAGWGGPVLVATKIDTSGGIENVVVVNHKETPAFFLELVNNSFFEQFVGKYVGDYFLINDDINAVSGATISSEGFTRAVRSSSHYIANTEFDLEIPESTFTFSTSGYLILLLFALAYFEYRFKIPKIRPIIMLMGLVVLGFYLNFPLSVSHITALIMGFLPNLESSLAWYVLLTCVLFTIVVVGRNLYCAWICPFGAVQELLHKISGISLPMAPWLIKYGKNINAFIAWISVCIIFISRNPALGNFEPFAAFFSFNGFGIIWVILPVIIFSSFFIKRFWCRFFCPVGFILTKSCNIQNKIIKQISSHNKTSHTKSFNTQKNDQKEKFHPTNKKQIINNEKK